MTTNNFEFETTGSFEWFEGKRIIPTKKISRQRHTALKNLCAENYHTNVRLKLCEIFDVPQHIEKQFKAIEKRHKKNNYLSYEDLQLRIRLTDDMLRYIEQHWHGAREHCERYYL